MGSTGQQRRARHAEERRQSLLEAAARVFAREGFERATTRKIAEEAEASEGTIYNYFSSKQDLLMALAEMVQAKLAAIVPASTVDVDDRATIVQAIESVLTVIVDNLVTIRGLLRSLWDQGYGLHGYLIPGARDLVARVESYLQARMEAGALRRCDAHTVARMVMGMVLYLCMPYVQGIETVPSFEQRHQHAELLVSVLLDGLRP